MIAPPFTHIHSVLAFSTSVTSVPICMCPSYCIYTASCCLYRRQSEFTRPKAKDCHIVPSCADKVPSIFYSSKRQSRNDDVRRLRRGERGERAMAKEAKNRNGPPFRLGNACIPRIACRLAANSARSRGICRGCSHAAPLGSISAHPEGNGWPTSPSRR